MNDFIAKPINPKKLMWTLVKWIQPSLPASPEPAGPAPRAEQLTMAELPGFDLRNLLEMIGHNQELAIRLLLTFSDNCRGLPEEIEALIAVKDWAAAQERVHKLKGAAGTIGAMALHAASEALEAELKQGGVALSLEHFRAVAEQTLAALAALSRPEEVLPDNGGDRDALNLAAAGLDQRLQDNDFIPDALLGTLKPHLSIEQLELFARLRRQISDLHYDQARRTLRQLAELPDIQEIQDDVSDQ
ncbi:Hpt domain-containing protein [Candidatus Methylobacter oryzae]|uniref:Hpt domain-containing protein n=1 Tax=Candidatus Methylobacter oryzae TaxID=2497749 RepID=A0ABY3CHP2_9GAMM|nr:Hpt domain-containing protein [Candidatus Methylobacter oryzae]TRX03635.1 Hpt domain-containing protein [Candidatus Methylobacter oryzae]